ncbi:MULTISPECIES: Nif11-like leader peptide family natural product precursor [unclassified Synechococcus]|uniref:Nif11-like leader peptide family natural product precursor n=1 Tax=unclassified Synechococcus TaxID=2626047 RepID=UPI00094158B6|nr:MULTISPECIES: Nif11-like leader peptide family natural product precursor [unclassified Synechococcus]
MSEEQLQAFLEKVKADTILQEKLKAAADADAVLSIAKEAGFSISADELENAQSKLSNQELEGVAGGGACPSTFTIDACAATGCNPKDL